MGEPWLTLAIAPVIEPYPVNPYIPSDNETGFQDVEEGRHEDFLRELGLFCLVFITGIVIKLIEHWFPLLKRLCWRARLCLTDPSNAELLAARVSFSWQQEDVNGYNVSKNTSYCNYMVFLRTCSFMFGILSLISFILSMLPNDWDYQPFFAGLLGSQISLTGTINDNGEVVPKELTLFQFSVLAVMTFVYGIVVLIFAWVLNRECKEPALPYAMAELMDRTLWLKWLPCEDRRQKTPFLLLNEEIEKVERDLSDAIEDQLLQAMPPDLDEGSSVGIARMPSLRPTTNLARRKTICHHRATLQATMIRQANRTRPTFIEQIHVMPVVDEWHATSLELRDQIERGIAYEQKSEGTKFSWMRRWYRLKRRNSLGSACKLRAKLIKVVRGHKRISGCAFVTFRDCEIRDMIMKKNLSFSGSMVAVVSMRQLIRGYSVFNFGRPPFASVTLKCEPAPHPDDLNWDNVHMHQSYRMSRYMSTSMLLFFVCVTMVKPELWNNVRDLLAGHGWFGKVAEWMGDVGGDVKMLKFVDDYMPTLVLLTINSLLLPCVIEWIALFERSKLFSIYENRQLQLNFLFLIINTMILKVVQEDTLSDLMQKTLNLFTNTGESSRDLMQEFGLLIMKLNGLHFIRYLFSASLVSNCVALLSSYRFAILECIMLTFFTVSARDRAAAQELSQWPWGYWYAWSLSIIAIALGASVMVPGTLPVASLFFLLKYRVDKYNLKNRVFSCGPENCGVFTTGVVWRMELIVGTFWICMGFMLYAAAKQVKVDHELGLKSKWCTQGLPIAVVACGFLVMLQGYIGKVRRTWVHSMQTRTTVRKRKEQERGSKKKKRGAAKSCGINLVKQIAECLPLREDAGKWRRPEPKEDSYRGDLSWNVREVEDYLWMDDTVKRAVHWFDANQQSLAQTEQVEAELDKGFDDESLDAAICRSANFENLGLDADTELTAIQSRHRADERGRSDSTYSVWDPNVVHESDDDESDEDETWAKSSQDSMVPRITVSANLSSSSGSGMGVTASLRPELKVAGLVYKNDSGDAQRHTMQAPSALAHRARIECQHSTNPTASAPLHSFAVNEMSREVKSSKSVRFLHSTNG